MSRYLLGFGERKQKVSPGLFNERHGAAVDLQASVRPFEVMGVLLTVRRVNIFLAKDST